MQLREAVSSSGSGMFPAWRRELSSLRIVSAACQLSSPRGEQHTSRRGALYVYARYALFFLHGVLRRPRFFTRTFSCRASKDPWVHCDACLDPGRAPRRCSEHSKSLSSLFLSRGCVPPRRAGSRACETPNLVLFFSENSPRYLILVSPFYYSLRPSPPAVLHHQSNKVFLLCCLLRRSYKQLAAATAAAARLSNIIRIWCT